MSPPLEAKEFRERMQRLESMIQEVEQSADASWRNRTREIVRTLLDLHGTGLKKILEKIADTGEAGQATIDALGDDEVVSSLLLLYGLHPLDLERRVRQAVEKAQIHLQAHGGSVELLAIVDGVVRLRMQGGSHGCSSTANALKRTVEEAIYENAPDVTAVEIEETQLPLSTFIPVEQLHLRNSHASTADGAAPEPRGGR